jgi:hypothetical protein
VIVNALYERDQVALAHTAPHAEHEGYRAGDNEDHVPRDRQPFQLVVQAADQKASTAKANIPNTLNRAACPWLGVSVVPTSK